MTHQSHIVLQSKSPHILVLVDFAGPGPILSSQLSYLSSSDLQISVVEHLEEKIGYTSIIVGAVGLILSYLAIELLEIHRMTNELSFLYQVLLSQKLNPCRILADNNYTVLQRKCEMKGNVTIQYDTHGDIVSLKHI